MMKKFLSATACRNSSPRSIAMSPLASDGPQMQPKAFFRVGLIDVDTARPATGFQANVIDARISSGNRFISSG